jgi:hypothetical protein
MKKFVLAMIAGTVCLSATTAACAEDAGNAKSKLIAAQDSFVALDRNGDHRLSRSEAGFDRLLSQTFAELDTDGDGFVSVTEFAAGDKVRATVSR